MSVCTLNLHTLQSSSDIFSPVSNACNKHASCTRCPTLHLKRMQLSWWIVIAESHKEHICFTRVRNPQYTCACAERITIALCIVWTNWGTGSFEPAACKQIIHMLRSMQWVFSEPNPTWKRWIAFLFVTCCHQTITHQKRSNHQTPERLGGGNVLGNCCNKW